MRRARDHQNLRRIYKDSSDEESQGDDNNEGDEGFDTQDHDETSVTPDKEQEDEDLEQIMPPPPQQLRCSTRVRNTSERWSNAYQPGF
jgi:hypothetical protein